VTQPVFDVSALKAFIERSGTTIPFLASITPLESLRHAEYLANEVPGVCVPPQVVDRMRRAEAGGRAAAEGLSIACEIAAEVRPLVRGVQISASADAIEIVLGVMKAVAA
jgi:homocysteine S-methyltransferase